MRFELTTFTLAILLLGISDLSPYLHQVPEAKQNSQIISGARSRDQAALVFKLAEKMVRLSPDLSKIIRIVPSQKMTNYLVVYNAIFLTALF